MNLPLTTVPPLERLKTTTSRCPTCRFAIPADILRVDGRIMMRKTCPAHGTFEVLLARDDRFYHLSLGAPDANVSACCGGSCGCGPTNDADAADDAKGATDIDRFETLSTCIALIEIVDSCNLTCPTCYASSPLGTGAAVDCTPFDDIVARVQGIIDRKGVIDILQLSGGEPTIHPEFERILEWAVTNDGIGYVLINTNAVRLATDAPFLDRLGALRRRHGRFELYVQFDGPQADGQTMLRGADLREIRRRAIDDAGARGIPSTLAMVVTPETRPHLGDTIRFGLERPHCRGISFQPMFLSGRAPNVETTLPLAPPEPITVGDVILDAVAQSDGLLTVDDFTPLPCGDPNCHTIGYLLRTTTGVHGLSRFVDLASLQGFLQDRVDYRLEDLAQCGCESEPLADLLKQFELGPDAPFRLFIKPFMDAWTFDEHRIDRCCTHVIREDGSLDSFCRYYLYGGASGCR
ncbi:MAG: radical SAM protein [Phycisphaerales bacterium]|nr:radical SAM protein [Phycisphaerales bacterium]